MSIPDKNSFCLFGASRIGVSLAFQLVKAGYKPVFIYNRSMTGLKKATSHVPFEDSSTQIPQNKIECDFVIISVNDDAIEEVSGNIAKAKCLNRGTEVFHNSGFLASDTLCELQQLGMKTGSLHPVISIPSIEYGIKNLNHAIFTCEGEIQSKLLKLVKSISGTAIPFTKKEKQIIHLSAVMLNNFSTTLISSVRDLYTNHGINEENGRKILHNLSKQAVKNGWEMDFPDAITGPASRGDYKTIEKHLQILESDPDLNQLYKIFSKLIVKKLDGNTNFPTGVLNEILSED